eukprot:GEMP01008128.1.p1 GENE.GEMP01008128.1~~GEMP01008128.1.p1  ORF type:complete len:1055 (+),score=299.90 GEMP01008128.1:71-3235(+)
MARIEGDWNTPAICTQSTVSTSRCASSGARHAAVATVVRSADGTVEDASEMARDIARRGCQWRVESLDDRDSVNTIKAVDVSCAPAALRKDSVSTAATSSSSSDANAVKTDVRIAHCGSALQELAGLNARYAEDAAELLGRCKAEAESVSKHPEPINARAAEQDNVAARDAKLAQRLQELARARVGLDLPAGDLESAVKAFLDHWQSSPLAPEAEAGRMQREDLRQQLQNERARLAQKTKSHATENAELETALAEARRLKSEEEKALEEFKQVRIKDTEIQSMKQQIAEMQQSLEHKKRVCSAAEALATQMEARSVEKAHVITQLTNELEDRVGELKFLAEENQQLRLEFETDVVDEHERPLSEETKAELDALKSEIDSVIARFPISSDDSMLPWAHVTRDALSNRHSNDLQRFQLQRETFPGVPNFPDDMALWPPADVMAPASGEDAREEATTRISAHAGEIQKWEETYHEDEEKLRSAFKKDKEKLIRERDDKVERLVASAEKIAAGSAQKQLLLKQAQLFSQRLDAKVASFDRFEDAVKIRLQSLEEEYVRQVDRETQVSRSVLKHATAYDFTCHLDLLKESVSLCWLEDACPKIVRHRVRLRWRLKKDMETRSLSQLQVTYEDFRVKECMRPQFRGVFAGARLVYLLHRRQHRIYKDLCRRQFFDFLLLLRFCQVAAKDLLQAEKIPELPAPDADLDDRDRLLLRLVNLARRTSDELHKSELRAFFRDGTKEVRMAVQCLCQNEPDLVDDVVSEELNMLSLNLRVKLFADRMDEIKEIREVLEEEVEGEVNHQLGFMARDIVNEERTVLEARKEFLEGKVVEQEKQVSNVASLLLHSYRDELEVVSAKLETICSGSVELARVNDEEDLAFEAFNDYGDEETASGGTIACEAEPEAPTTLTLIMREQAREQRELMIEAERAVPMPPSKSATHRHQRPLPCFGKRHKVPVAEKLCEWPFQSSAADSESTSSVGVDADGAEWSNSASNTRTPETLGTPETPETPDQQGDSHSPDVYDDDSSTAHSSEGILDLDDDYDGIIDVDDDEEAEIHFY